jgi:Flp pilus assembly protein TadD
LLPGATLPSISPETDSTGLGLSAARPESQAEPEPAAGTNAMNDSRISFLMNTGVQYEDEGEYADAEQAYLKALEKAPGNSRIRFRLSMLYIQMKRYFDAVDLLEKLSAEFSDNALIQNNLAWVYATGGDMKNGKMALRHAREALLSTPYAPSIWNTLAEAYYVSGQYDKALRSSDQALDLLSRQKPSNEEIAAFKKQHTKIQRAVDASQMMRDFEAKK